jgi:surface polysaccharide O-acyltransferase-like enzyme
MTDIARDAPAAVAVPAAATVKPRRRAELDLLRIAACLIQFPFHTSMVFNSRELLYHVKNPVTAPAFDVIAIVLELWRMPLFFFIAGWAAVTALASRTVGGFVGERFARLGPPFIVGIILIAAPIKYLERLSGINIRAGGIDLSAPPLDIGYGAFLYRFFTRINWFSWSHLWFLFYLLIFCLLAGPLLKSFARTNAPAASAPIAWICLPALLLTGFEGWLRPITGYLHNFYGDWASLALYTVYFLAGAAIARRPEVEAMIVRHWPLLLALGALGVALRLAWRDTPAGFAAQGFAGWYIVIGLLGLGNKVTTLRRPTALDRYLGDATLPLYVLHHLPVVALAFLMLRLDWNPWIKAAIICFGSAGVTFTAYHLLVRPWNPVRMLFGMRPRGG